jgi:ribosome biogenesis GTPase A
MKKRRTKWKVGKKIKIKNKIKKEEYTMDYHSAFGFRETLILKKIDKYNFEK